MFYNLKVLKFFKDFLVVIIIIGLYFSFIEYLIKGFLFCLLVGFVFEMCVIKYKILFDFLGIKYYKKFFLKLELIVWMYIFNCKDIFWFNYLFFCMIM